jgi:cell division ATPase FtsA
MQRREAIKQGFVEDIEAAHVCAQRALNALYDEHGPKRSLWYRMRLGKAQSILINLHQQELKKQREER